MRVDARVGKTWKRVYKIATKWSDLWHFQSNEVFLLSVFVL